MISIIIKQQLFNGKHKVGSLLNQPTCVVDSCGIKDKRQSSALYVLCLPDTE